jgi:hypothetical protein
VKKDKPEKQRTLNHPIPLFLQNMGHLCLQIRLKGFISGKNIFFSGHHSLLLLEYPIISAILKGGGYTLSIVSLLCLFLRAEIIRK